MARTKVDLKREFDALYTAGREPALVDVPELPFLSIDGHGDPNTAPEYAEAVQAIYQVAYTLKFTLKRAEDGIDYGVMPLEGLWWVPDMTTFSTSDKSDWDWTMMILQPSVVTEPMVEQAKESAASKHPSAAIARVRLERFEEGEAAQVMHIGPYADEGPTIARLHAFIDQAGLDLSGKHHEIYLGDPRRAAPEKLRTIIRQPVSRRPG
ncbi:GyrI-like domain-containing protein [Aeromicrobium sp.]|uniref:GyrI-like domain-containing protein n=1 Tax=Aeromicrobium sp. TaxID=1871063 RepID=UPI002FC63E79